MIDKIDSSYFTWQIWRANDFFSEFGIPIRYNFIQKKNILEKAIGFCEGAGLLCRPKYNTYAVMFWDGNTEWWTHFSKYEFERIFRNEFE